MIICVSDVIKREEAGKAYLRLQSDGVADPAASFTGVHLVENAGTKFDKTKQNYYYFIMVSMWDIFHYNKNKEELKGM